MLMMMSPLQGAINGREGKQIAGGGAPKRPTCLSSTRRSPIAARPPTADSASVLPGVELALAGHCDGKWRGRVHPLPGPGVLWEQVGQPPIGHRAFIEVGPDQR